MYALPREHEILKTFKRPEIDLQTVASGGPKPEAMEKLFVQPVKMAERQVKAMAPAERARYQWQKHWDAELQNIMGPQTWPSPSPETKVSIALEMQCMLDMMVAGSYDLADECWRSAFVPRHEVIIERGAGRYYMCLIACDAGTLMWPLQETSGNFLVFDRGVESLTTYFLDDFEKVKVQPVVAASPLHQRLAGHANTVGICLRRTGPAIDLIDWHIDNGFPLVSESNLKMLFKHSEFDMPDPTQGEDYRMVLKTDFMKQARDDLRQEDVIIALNKCVRKENPDAFADPFFDEDMLNDVALPKEKGEFTKFHKDVQAGLGRLPQRLVVEGPISAFLCCGPQLVH